MRVWIAVLLAWLCSAVSALAENRLAVVVDNDADRQMRVAEPAVSAPIDSAIAADAFAKFIAGLPEAPKGQAKAWSEALKTTAAAKPAPKPAANPTPKPSPTVAPVADPAVAAEIDQANADALAPLIAKLPDGPLKERAKARAEALKKTPAASPAPKPSPTVSPVADPAVAAEIDQANAAALAPLIAKLPDGPLKERAKARAEALTKTPAATPAPKPSPPATVADAALAAEIDQATVADALAPLIAKLPAGPLKERAKTRAEALKKTANSAPPTTRPSPITAGGERRYPLPAGAELVPIKSDGRESLYSIDYSPQGDRIVGWSGDDTVVLWDVVKGKLLWSESDSNDGVGFVAFSADGSRVASGGHGDAIRIRDAANGKILLTINPKDTNVQFVGFSPNGQWIAVADADEKIEIWNTTTGKLLRTLGGRPGCNCYSSLAISSDGAHIVSASNKTISLWDAANGRLLRTFKGNSDVLDVVFSPNGAHIVSGNDDKTIKVWDTATGRLLSSFEAHAKGVTSVALSRDGARIASASFANDSSIDSKVIKLWDAATGKLLRTLQGHTEDIQAIRFSPGASRVASGSMDGTIKLWDVETGALLASFAASGRHGVAYTPDGLFVTDVEPGAAFAIVRGGQELPLDDRVALNRRDNLAEAIGERTAAGK